LKNEKYLEWKKMIMLTIAGIVNAIGITFFLTPVNLYDSGISGTSMLVSQLTPGHISLSLCLLVFNIPLFLYGLKRQGWQFTFYAIYTVVVYSAVAWFITEILPIDVTTDSPLAGTDLLLCAVFGGLISGVGSGLAIRNGGAMDGIEVMAVIFAKRLGVSVGTFVMAYNLLLYIACGIATKSWILPLYSILTYAAALKTIDFIVEGLDRAKSAMIITDKPDEICSELSDAFETGTTKIDAVGGYSNSNKTVIYFVVNRFQVTKMKDIVHEIDPCAYITISEVADVFAKN
jgi:uncharacterized membrane-anchored protein YitT (DUF2179 family)